MKRHSLARVIPVRSDLEQGYTQQALSVAQTSRRISVEPKIGPSARPCSSPEASLPRVWSQFDAGSELSNWHDMGQASELYFVGAGWAGWLGRPRSSAGSENDWSSALNCPQLV